MGRYESAAYLTSDEVTYLLPEPSDLRVMLPDGVRSANVYDILLNLCGQYQR